MQKLFTDILKEKVVVFDGAMGTNLQRQNLSPDDFGGEKLAGCNEHLVVSRPSAVEDVHASFLKAGCDVIETDTFGGAPIVLAEYGLADEAYRLNAEAARLAARMARDFSTPAHPRFAAGSIGPTTKLPSLGHIGFEAMEESFHTQARGLLDGGVDLLVVETCQDLLQSKAALAAVFRAMRDARRRVPVVASVTIETTGTMLLGTEIAAALTALASYEIDLFGMNCATGPQEMSENVRYLAANSPFPIFVMPNAGLPENVGGHAHYSLTPEAFTSSLSHFVKDLGVNVVGGCCGTTPEHLAPLAAAVGSLSPSPRTWAFTPGCASLYQTAPFHTEPPPVLVGERTNANGSKLFRELLAREDWEGMVAMGKEQAKEGAHLIDVCAAYVGRDEARDMRELVYRLNTQVTVPLMIDSTEAPVIEEALRRIAGKAVVNSINMEDGEERMAAVLPLCRTYGAAVVALTIDEEGMAKSASRKLAVARRIFDIATAKYGMKPHDLIFDALTFTLGSGDGEFRRSGIETLEAIRAIKRELPGVATSLGVSNVSFGLAPRARHLLNSVFLHYAIEYGLDMAIVHASKIQPLYTISEEEREICRRLIFDERDGSYDPLERLLALASGPKGRGKGKGAAEGAPGPPASIEERLKNRIIEGNKVGLEKELDEARTRYAPLDIINTILLDGMKVVGDLFGSGQMQLPFVLQSAEAMKASVAHLERFMDKESASTKGSMIIATVKGDVHDIGKNLVDIILTNNGYTVVNLGIQCPLDRMLHAFEERRADAIGMSGLLVKSTLIMKENLQVMEERGLLPPVILGGAALTRRYVENDLRAVYRGPLYYANDAFDGLRFMEEITAAKRAGGALPASPARPAPSAVRGEDDDSLAGLEAKIALAAPAAATAARVRSVAAAGIPTAPFFGTKVVSGIDPGDVYPYINETALIRGQWQVRRGRMSEEDYRKLVAGTIEPELRALQRSAKENRLLRPAVVYGYYPCRSDGDDVVIFRPANGADPTDPRSWGGNGAHPVEWLRFTFPRQSKGKGFCIADFFAPASSGGYDVVAFHLVTMGKEASEHTAALFAANNYKEYLYFHGLSVEAAEALAELWHKKIREELGIAGSDDPDIRKLFSQHYRGSRYSFGYPACPSLEDQTKLFTLLRPERIGVALTEEFQLVPEQSTSAIVVHHPEARYFNV